MQARKCSEDVSYMLYALTRRLKCFLSKIRRKLWNRPRPKLVIKRLGKFSSKAQPTGRREVIKSQGHQNGFSKNASFTQRPIRIATFNAALFSLAPAVPKAEKSVEYVHTSKIDDPLNPMDIHPKGILKRSPLHPMVNGISENRVKDNNLCRTKSKVSINLPENEISLAHNKVVNIIEDSLTFSFNNNSLAAMRSPICFPASMAHWLNDASLYGTRTIFDVLKEVDADILALQDVKAEEENEMKPLSGLAHALGMHYVFAESWAPEYGNAILSKWPIKKWKVQRIYDDQDFRNVVKATIEVPWTGDINIYCTQLDHLDESWRMKQINAIIQSSDHSHLLVGGLNSLNASDYSLQRWTDIVKYYEEIGKPTPKVEVTSFLKGREYTDAENFTGECEPVVMIAKGQNVQGTCKYGTRVDYMFGSKDLPYKFVPGSYSVISSKGTSDHHIVKADIVKVEDSVSRSKSRQKKLTQRVVRKINSCSSRGTSK